MKSFLRHHWQEINTRSGQPFSYDLLELESYDYDTEPACRAMVAYRSLKQANDLEFLSPFSVVSMLNLKTQNQQSFIVQSVNHSIFILKHFCHFGTASPSSNKRKRNL